MFLSYLLLLHLITNIATISPYRSNGEARGCRLRPCLVPSSGRGGYTAPRFCASGGGDLSGGEENGYSISLFSLVGLFFYEKNRGDGQIKEKKVFLHCQTLTRLDSCR